jgi:phosphoglycolate phosphatase
MYNLALFDLDGTLTDPKEGIAKSVQYALSAFGIHIADLDELEKFIGPPLRDSFQAYYGFTPEQAEAAVAKYREYFTDAGIFENTLYPGIIGLLAELKSRGAKLAVATSKPTVYAERIIAHFALDGYFDLISGSELDGTRSRKSEIIACVLELFPVNYTRHAVMIGDSKYDMIGANEIGIDALGVLWGYGSREELKEAGALDIAATPAELRDLILEGM